MAYEAYLDKEKRFKLQAKDASINHVNRIFYCKRQDVKHV